MTETLGAPDELLFNINFPMCLGPIKKFNAEIFGRGG